MSRKSRKFFALLIRAAAPSHLTALLLDRGLCLGLQAPKFQKKGILYAGTIAVDNVVTAIWIMITLIIPTFLNRIWKSNKKFISNKNKSIGNTYFQTETGGIIASPRYNQKIMSSYGYLKRL